MSPTPRERFRRRLLAWFVPIGAVFGHPAFGQTESHIADAQPPVEAVSSVGCTVSDLDRSIRFFTDVLTFETVSRGEVSGDALARTAGVESPKGRVARLKLGDEWIELAEYITPKGRPFPADSRSNDLWFQHIAIIVSDMERAYARLVAHGVPPASKSGPQRLPDWNKNAAGIRVFYFRDPDGHFLEILQFPPEKGDPKWHKPSDRLFLGIDHTAIVVGDTDASLRFYRDTLGFGVVGGSENYGTEQENLNNVPGAHLRITTLRAASGPAIELLEYLMPRDGRPYPIDARPNDTLHWQTTLVSGDPARAVRVLEAGKFRFESFEVAPDASSRNEPQPAFLVRDPDGHVMRIVAE